MTSPSRLSALAASHRPSMACPLPASAGSHGCGHSSDVSTKFTPNLSATSSISDTAASVASRPWPQSAVPNAAAETLMPGGGRGVV